MRVCATLSVLPIAAASPASAIPYFAHEYGLACQKCHTVVPRLNDFGEAFLEHGYQLPGATRNRVFPLATKINLAYTSEPDPSGLPKATVDEVEVFLAGTPSSRTNYFVEQYLVDGGRPGATRDAWIAQRLSGEGARVPVYLQAGAFTLPVPVEPETFRETSQHYAVFDQVVGSNPFNFFDPKSGVLLRAGRNDAGLQVQAAVLQGHDKQSGLATVGADTMASAAQTFGPLTLSLYRYDGRRPDGLGTNRFWRQGFGIVAGDARWTSETVLQTGHDGSIDGGGTPGSSSGGFTQLRYELNRRVFAVARYEGTNDPVNGIARDFVGTLGYRMTRNSRLTVEDVVQHVPWTKHTLNTQYLVAY